MFWYVFELVYGKMEYCGRVLPCNTRRPDGWLETLQEIKGFQEYGVGGPSCGCNISSSEALEGFIKDYIYHVSCLVIPTL